MLPQFSLHSLFLVSFNTNSLRKLFLSVTYFPWFYWPFYSAGIAENSILNGVYPQKNLENLLEKIKSRIDAVDAIFLTGDISQDKTKKSYSHIGELLQNIGKKIYWLPGNHDDPFVMKKSLKRFSHFYPLTSLIMGSWQFLVLDTVKKNSDVGYLPEKITAHVEKNTFYALLMHHHPVKIGTPLVDKYMLQNPEILGNFITAQDKKPNLIITGHVHGDYQALYNNIPVISSPATSFQFAKKSIIPTIEPIGGCTFFEFNTNGDFSYEYFFE